MMLTLYVLEAPFSRLPGVMVAERNVLGVSGYTPTPDDVSSILNPSLS